LNRRAASELLKVDVIYVPYRELPGCEADRAIGICCERDALNGENAVVLDRKNGPGLPDPTNTIIHDDRAPVGTVASLVQGVDGD
jgi:hypothetical protein